jgi:hypothetical protein
MNTLLNNDISLYYLIPCAVCLISGYFIKSYFYPTVIKTPNSPQTFNLSSEQLKDINEIFDRGEELDKETKDKLDEDFKTIIGEENQAYVVTFEFVTSLMMYNEDGPIISLGKPILISKNSNAQIISNYLKSRINLTIDTYYLDDSILDSNNNPDGPSVIVNYSKINLFFILYLILLII